MARFLARGLHFTHKCCAPISIPIATHALHAVGAAMAAQRLNEDSVTVAFLGDGATSEGDTHEAMNLAAVEQAPASSSSRTTNGRSPHRCGGN